MEAESGVPWIPISGSERPIQRVPSGLPGPGGTGSAPAAQSESGGYHQGFFCLSTILKLSERRRVRGLAGRDAEPLPQLHAALARPAVEEQAVRGAADDDRRADLVLRDAGPGDLYLELERAAVVGAEVAEDRSLGRPAGEVAADLGAGHARPQAADDDLRVANLPVEALGEPLRPAVEAGARSRSRRARTAVPSGAASAARTAPSTWKSAPRRLRCEAPGLGSRSVSVSGSDVILRTARSACAAVRPDTSDSADITPGATTFCSGSPAACCARAPASTPIRIMARKATKVRTRAPRREVR